MMRMRRRTLASVLSACSAAASLAVGCSSHQQAGPVGGADASTDALADAASDSVTSYHAPAYDGLAPPAVDRIPVYADVVSNHVDVQSRLFAAGEMQIS